MLKKIGVNKLTLDKRKDEQEQNQSVSSKLYADVKIKGLDVLKNLSADSIVVIEATCTGRTSIEITLFKA